MRTRKNKFFAFFIFSLSLLSCEDRDKMNMDTVAFLKEASVDLKFEIATSKLAVNRASTYDVRTLGQTLFRDYNTIKEELNALGKVKKINLTDTLAGEQELEYRELSTLEKFSFDKQYVDMVIRNSEAYIEKFKEAASKANDAEARKFANKTLSTFENHYGQANKVKEILNSL